MNLIRGLKKYATLQRKSYFISFKVCTYLIEDQQSLHFSHIHVACSCISLSREMLKFKDPWSPYLANVYNIGYEEFQSCLNLMYM